MKCEDCAYKRGITYKSERYGISCEVNGEFTVHEDNSDAFMCENYERMSEPPVPPSDNVLIILNSGRDITVYDKDITCLKDIGDRINEVANMNADKCYVLFGKFQFCVKEIAVWGYLDGM